MVRGASLGVNKSIGSAQGWVQSRTMRLGVRFFPLLLCALAIGGCARRDRPVQAAPVGPEEIGRVVAVHRELGFVLIESQRAVRLQPGTELLAGGTDSEAGRLRLSGERRRPYVTADLAGGPVAEGDRVYLPAPADSAVPTE